VIAELLVALLGGVGVAYIVAPLRRATIPYSETDRFTEEALARKNNALDALIDIDEERAAGKLSAGDHDALKAELEVEVVRALDNLEALGSSDEELEAEIAAMRDRLACPQCGTLKPPGKPCPRCDS
jgi:rubrerythrin